MAVRSKRLGSAIVTVAASQLLLTVPAGRTAIVKHLSAGQALGVAATTRFHLDGAGNQVVGVLTTGNVTSAAYEEVFLVLGPGEELIATTTTATGVFVVASGALLLGVWS